MNQKCKICRQPIKADCNYNQGRCPHVPAAIEITSYRKLLCLLAAPFIIGAWVVMNPVKIWAQAKHYWNIR
jgi:hypothetical protein